MLAAYATELVRQQLSQPSTPISKRPATRTRHGPRRSRSERPRIAVGRREQRSMRRRSRGMATVIGHDRRRSAGGICAWPKRPGRPSAATAHPKVPSISYLYRTPQHRSAGTNNSHTPGPWRFRIGCRRPSHPLKSPTTETRCALGAQTANRTPVDVIDLGRVRTLGSGRNHGAAPPPASRCRPRRAAVGRSTASSVSQTA